MFPNENYLIDRLILSPGRRAWTETDCVMHALKDELCLLLSLRTATRTSIPPLTTVPSTTKKYHTAHLEASTTLCISPLRPQATLHKHPNTSHIQHLSRQGASPGDHLQPHPPWSGNCNSGRTHPSNEMTDKQINQPNKIKHNLPTKVSVQPSPLCRGGPCIA